jgi:diguanylate cyclase (GGDEF)-like protein
MLPDTEEDGAASWAERCRAAVAETPCVAGPNTVHVTVSLGVAQRSSSSENLEQLLDLADQALLAAKRQGRNRVVRHGSLK